MPRLSARTVEDMDRMLRCLDGGHGFDMRSAPKMGADFSEVSGTPFTTGVRVAFAFGLNR